MAVNIVHLLYTFVTYIFYVVRKFPIGGEEGGNLPPSQKKLTLSKITFLFSEPNQP